jgi:YidC/Oxa1 family membrane protein insertase
MDIKKIALYIALAVIGIMLWTQWQKDYPPQPEQGPATVATQKQTGQDSSDFKPSVTMPSQKGTSATGTTTTPLAKKVYQPGKLIHIRTNVLDIAIDTTGGNIVVARLVKYPKSLKEKNIPVQILSPASKKLYIAQSGVVSAANNKPTGKIIFQSAQSNYQLGDKQRLTVVLNGKTQNGLKVSKIFEFKKDSYAIKVTNTVHNESAAPWAGSIFYQIRRRNVPVKHAMHSSSYNGAAISSPQDHYQKLSYKHLMGNTVNRDIRDGWIAMQQQYFLSAWVPPSTELNKYYSQVQGNNEDGKYNIFTVGFHVTPFILQPNQTKSSTATFYVGPEIAKLLTPISETLKYTIDYGWLAPISIILFWIMQKIYLVVGNWGWTIVLVTLLIKLIFYWPSAKSYKSMAKMREIAPRLQALKERHGDDKQALSKATMEFYKKEKVNPMGGCLPILIQIPVFIALYWVLIESVELRQAPFILWIHDLSVKDPYFILPILMGISMFVQQKLSPPPPDPTQAKVMMFLPLIFTVFFATFPAGLVLYWLTNNLISILQQWYVMKSYDPKKEKQRKKKRKKK